MKGKVLTLFLILTVGLWANGLNLNSLGSRAQAMGGAYVSIADDPTAVFWNPAGAGLFSRRTVGIYMAGIIPSGSYQFSFLGIDAQYSKTYLTGLFGIYYPLNEKLTLGLALYTPSGLGTDWDGQDFAPLSGGRNLKWGSKVGVLSISPVLAYRFSEKILFGVSLNANYGMMDLDTSAGTYQYSESSKGWGYGATLGLLIKPSDRFSLGLSVKTASKVSLSGDVTMEVMRVYSALYGTEIPTTSGFTRDITWPMWVGAGLSFRPTDNLILSLDVHWTQWSKENVIITDYENSLWKILFSATPKKEEEMVLHWKDTTQIRFGAEYRVSDALAIRAGYYMDPSPAPDETMNVLLPSFDFNVITFGVGYSGSSYSLDIGVEYLMGKERNIEATEHNMPGVYRMNILVPSVSFTYKF